MDDPERDAEAMADSIELFSKKFDPADQVTFYGHLTELVTQCRDELEKFLQADSRKPN